MPDSRDTDYEDIPVLPENVPVVMPELPAGLQITTSEQFKAFGEPTRERMLSILQQRPVTAKQLAALLGIAPGTAGHHLQTLEAAGLAQVVARRLVRGIVAKYYTRTARMFLFDRYDEVGDFSALVSFLESAQIELRDAEQARAGAPTGYGGFPHARITRERALEYRQRIDDLITEFLAEPSDPLGEVIGLCSVIFVAPPYLQGDGMPDPPTANKP